MADHLLRSRRSNYVMGVPDLLSSSWHTINGSIPEQSRKNRGSSSNSRESDGNQEQEVQEISSNSWNLWPEDDFAIHISFCGSYTEWCYQFFLDGHHKRYGLFNISNHSTQVCRRCCSDYFSDDWWHNYFTHPKLKTFDIDCCQHLVHLLCSTSRLSSKIKYLGAPCLFLAYQ